MLTPNTAIRRAGLGGGMVRRSGLYRRTRFRHASSSGDIIAFPALRSSRMYSLEVRVVIITGSSEGIGARLATALRGARIEAGSGS